jgi:hypothetical protein
MAAAITVVIELVLGIGLMVLAPLWILSFVQLLKWWHIAERQLKPGVYLADTRPLLLGFFGRAAVLFQPDMLTGNGLDARRAAIKWFRRMMLLVAAAVALILLNEFVHPGGDWRAAENRSDPTTLEDVPVAWYGGPKLERFSRTT